MTSKREHLEQLFAETDGLPMDAAELDRCRKLARLLANWRVLEPALDWSAQAKKLSAAIREDAEMRASAHIDHLIDPSLPAISTEELPAQCVSDYRAVDDILQNAALPLPPVDWNALSSKISSAVRREAHDLQAARRLAARRIADPDAGRRGAGSLLFRLGVPLAAAAAIAFAVWVSRSTSQIATGPHSKITVATQEPPESKGKVSITFDEARPADAVNEDVPVEGSGIAVGPPAAESSDPPIDPAMIP